MREGGAQAGDEAIPRQWAQYFDGLSVIHYENSHGRDSGVRSLDLKRGGLLLSGKGGRTVKRLPLPRLRFSRRAVRAIAEDDDAQGNGLYKKRSRRNRPSPEIVRYSRTQWRRS